MSLNLILTLAVLLAGLSPAAADPAPRKSAATAVEKGPTGCKSCGSCVCRCRNK